MKNQETPKVSQKINKLFNDGWQLARVFKHGDFYWDDEQSLKLAVEWLATQGIKLQAGKHYGVYETENYTIYVCMPAATHKKQIKVLLKKFWNISI